MIAFLEYTLTERDHHQLAADRRLGRRRSSDGVVLAELRARSSASTPRLTRRRTLRRASFRSPGTSARTRSSEDDCGGRVLRAAPGRHDLPRRGRSASMTPQELLAAGEIARGDRGPERSAAREADRPRRALVPVRAALLRGRARPRDPAARHARAAERRVRHGLGRVPLARASPTRSARRCCTRAGESAAAAGLRRARRSAARGAARAARGRAAAGAQRARARRVARARRSRASSTARPSTDLFDSDELLGPVLEVFAGGHYLWLPLERVRTLEIRRAEHQLELLWLPRELEDRRRDDGDGPPAGALPRLARGRDDARLRSGQMTEWREQDGGVCARSSARRCCSLGAATREREVRAARAAHARDSTPAPSEAQRG